MEPDSFLDFCSRAQISIFRSHDDQSLLRNVSEHIGIESHFFTSLLYLGHWGKSDLELVAADGKGSKRFLESFKWRSLQHDGENPFLQALAEERILYISDAARDARIAPGLVAEVDLNAAIAVSIQGPKAIRGCLILTFTGTNVRPSVDIELERRLVVLSSHIGGYLSCRDFWDGKESELSGRLLAEKNARHFLFEALRQSPSGIIVASLPRGRIVMVNDAALEIRGEKAERLTDIEIPDHSPVWNTFYLDGRPCPSEDLPLSRAILHGEHCSDEQLIIRDRHGIDHFVSVNAAPVCDETGNQIGGVATFHDISDWRQQAESLDRKSRMLSVLSDINSLIVRNPEKKNLLREACEVIVHSGGFDLAMADSYRSGDTEVWPISAFGRIPEHATRLMRIGQPAVDGAGLIGECIRNGQLSISNSLSDEGSIISKRRRVSLQLGYASLAVLPLKLQGSVVATLSIYTQERGFFHEEELRILEEICADLSFALENCAKQERENFLAYYNTITGIPNRTFFIKQLQQHFHTHRKLEEVGCLTVIDVIGFSRVNEAFGRYSGDLLLKVLSQRILKEKPEEALLAHLERDHFALYSYPHSSPEEAALMIHSLMESCAAPVELGRRGISVQLKAGVAMHPTDAASPEELLARADAARRTHRPGQERLTFYSRRMNASAARSLVLENRIRRAIANQEFELHLQPKFLSQDLTLAGAEALLRWKDPEIGFVPPSQFIPILEESGMIVEVGFWVIGHTLERLQQWSSHGYRLPSIAINLSTVQLRNSGFLKSLQDLLRTFGDVKNRLEVEITESTALEEDGLHLDTLHRIRQLGISIAIDDFGTGYSSLKYIASLPMDSLKIDRTFVKDLGENRTNELLVSMIIGLAHNLGHAVTAEGVETELQKNVLAGLSCDVLQGFLFARPMPMQRFAELYLPAN